MNNNYPKGSEWRKWDLHLHTPASYDYKDMSVNAKFFVEKLKENNISVVAITDHHVISEEWIEDIRKEAGNDITVLPGIELRTGAGTGENIHIIGIFPEESNLNHDAVEGKYQIQDLISTLGISKQRSEGKGNDEIFVDLNTAIEEIHKLGGIATIHAGKKSDGIEKITNAIPTNRARKQDIAEKIDVFEIGKIEDVKEYRDIVFKHIEERAMILCSDNHDIKNYKLKAPCWIKANPTFEGLKQIIYEPCDRVFIGNHPDDIKDNYQVIESISFKNKDGNNTFTQEPILFNDNLNTIIGGKSTGKSLLLRLLAKTIDPEEVREKMQNRDDQYSEIEDKIENIIIKYKDGQEVTKSPSNCILQRKITYIPQNWLNKCTDSSENKNVNEILWQIIKSKYKDSYTEKESIAYDSKILKSSIDKDIIKYFEGIRSVASLKKERKIKGDLDAIVKAKKETEDKIQKLLESDELNVSEDKIREYEKYHKELNNFKIQLERINKTIEGLGSFNIRLFFDNERAIDSLSNIGIDDFKNKFDEKFENFETEIIKLKKIHTQNQIKEQTSLKERIDQVELKYDLLKKEFETNTALNQELFALKFDVQNKEQFINEINVLDSEIKDKEQNLQELYGNIIKDFRSFKARYISISNKLNTSLKSGLDGVKEDDIIQISIEPKFNLQKYQDIINKNVNLQSSEANKILNYSKEKLDEGECFNEIIHKVLSGDIKTKSNTSNEDFVKILLDNFYSLETIIKYQDDSFNKMSSGKKAIVFLKLLISLDESTHPILIDQPEDDLDNRSVWRELVHYIKDSKKKRQIIIVTHNPNLVVGSDAEEIIVANQNGESDNKNQKYRFEYVSGAIENSFKNKESEYILHQMGIREHICDILEGGEMAFKKREDKYSSK